MSYKTSRENLYTEQTPRMENGLSAFVERSNNYVALMPWLTPSRHLLPRRATWEGIDKYRRSNLTIKTALIVHHDEEVRRFINNYFTDLIDNKFVGKPSPWTWDVGFYYALNEDDQLTFYAIPILIDGNGEGLDYYTPVYGDVDPAYYFKPGIAGDPPGDEDEIAWDFGHIKPITLPLQ